MTETLVSIWKIVEERRRNKIVQLESTGQNMTCAIEQLRIDIEGMSVSHGEEGRMADLMVVYVKGNGETIPNSWYDGFAEASELRKEEQAAASRGEM